MPRCLGSRVGGASAALPGVSPAQPAGRRCRQLRPAGCASRSAPLQRSEPAAAWLMIRIGYQRGAYPASGSSAPACGASAAAPAAGAQLASIRGASSFDNFFNVIKPVWPVTRGSSSIVWASPSTVPATASRQSWPGEKSHAKFRRGVCAGGKGGRGGDGGGATAPPLPPLPVGPRLR